MSNNDELLKLENDIYLSNEGIYFAVYDNAFTKNFIEDKLIKRFKARNINVLIINSDNFQLGKTLIDKQKNIRTDTVFFSYPPLDMNKFIQYTENLNYTRDFFKNIKYPVIIWVSNEDLNLIIENAPDFWAWRSRVVSFRSKRDKRLFEFEKHEWKEKVSDELIDSIEKDLHRFEIQNDLFEVAKTSALLADLYFRTGKWDRSIQFYYKNLETFEKLGDVHGMAQTYNNLGLVYTDKGEWDKAIEFYEKSLETLEKVGDVNGMALTYGNLGSVYARKGEWDKAIEFYEKDLKISEKVGDVNGITKTYGNLGIVYADKGEWDKAIEFYKKSLETKEKVGDVHGIAKTYGNLGIVYARKGEWDKAIEFYEKSLETKEKVGDVIGIAKTYSNLGLVYAKKGEWNKAIEFYEKSLKTLEKVGDVHSIAKTYSNLGLVYADKGEWDKAIEFYEKSLETLEKVGDVHGMAQTYNNLGIIYAKKGEWDMAIEFYEKSLETKEKVGDVHGMAQTYGNLGIVYANKGEWDNAIEFYEKSLETKEKVGDVHGMVQTYNNLGLVYAKKGEWDKAIEFYEKDLKISEKMGDVHGMAQTYGNLGIVYADKGEWDKAIEFYEKSLQTLEKVGDVHGMGGTYVNLGKLYLEKSELQQAKENLEKSIKLIHPDARPDYPNAMNWLAACERMLADVLKEKIKQTSDKKEKYMLMDEATSLYNKSSERYYTVSKLRLARMPRSINSDIHITKALAFSVQNLVIDDDKKAIKLLEEAIKEIQSAIPYSDGYNAIKLQGMLANHRAKSKIREAVLNKDKPKKHKKKIEEAIKFLEEATKTYQRLGDDGACSSSVCNGCVHLYRGLVLVGEYIETKNVDKEISAVKEFVEAKKCYEDSELGKESIGIIDKIISLSTRLARKETEDWDSIRTSVEELLKLSDDISFIGLKKMVKIYTFDKLEEDKEPEVDKKKEPIFIIDLYPLQI